MGVTDRDDSDLDRTKSVTFVALAAEVLEHRVEIERLRAENAELRRTLADEIERLRAYVRPM
jgi:hypothetical protein